MPNTAQQLRLILDNGRLADVGLNLNGREVLMLGTAGPGRERAIVPAFSSKPEGGKFTPGHFLPVLLGGGLGYALSGLVAQLQAGLGRNYALAVVDRETRILEASRLRERFPQANIAWISAESPQEALRELSIWQQSHGGLPLFPIANPFYLRLDRDYYSAVRDAALASSRFDFWGRTNYPRFASEKPRLLLLTSKYFLMGEVTASCDRLGLPHHLIQVPDSEVGQNEFVEELLSAILKFRPDFVLTINHLGVDREGVLAGLLEKLRLPLASWFVDNPHLVLYLYDRLVSPWTAIFTWDSDNIDSLRAMGFEHVFYLPLGTDVTRFVPGVDPARQPAAWRSEVSFVGNSMLHKVFQRMERSSLPQALLESYRQVAAGFADSQERSVRDFLAQAHPALLPAFNSLGTHEQRLGYETMLTWEATRQYRLDCVRATLPHSPLIVGDDGWKILLKDEAGPWRYHPELNYYSDLPRFYPCSLINFNCTSKQMKGAVNQRVFDVPATGSFILTDWRAQMDNLLEPGREVACYHNPEEAQNLLRHYLDHPAERAQIALAARKRILAEHSYEARLTTLCGVMKKTFK